MRWTADQVTLSIVADQSEDDVLTIVFETPDQGLVLFMAEFEIDDSTRTLHARGAHIQSHPAGIGVANLRLLARLALEKVDCDVAIIEGAVRTTGAHPGHLPRPIRFTCLS